MWSDGIIKISLKLKIDMKIGEGKNNIERRKYLLHGCKIFPVLFAHFPSLLN